MLIFFVFFAVLVKIFLSIFGFTVLRYAMISPPFSPILPKKKKTQGRYSSTLPLLGSAFRLSPAGAPNDKRPAFAGLRLLARFRQTLCQLLRHSI
nr:MAG TPA: hypothetical protein [Microviridae sp.]